MQQPEKVFKYIQNAMRLALDGDKRLACTLADAVALYRLCALEDMDAPMICATRTHPANKSQLKKREGARNMVDSKRAQALADGSLTPASATTYRGLGDPGIHMSQHRPDVSYSTNKLCRVFSVPDNTSLANLSALGGTVLGDQAWSIGLPSKSDQNTWTPMLILTSAGVLFAGCAVTLRWDLLPEKLVEDTNHDSFVQWRNRTFRHLLWHCLNSWFAIRTP